LVIFRGNRQNGRQQVLFFLNPFQDVSVVENGGVGNREEGVVALMVPIYDKLA
jgi:hypothetical protein